MAFYNRDGSITYTKPELERHHPWCHRHQFLRQGCTICDEFYLKYPPRQNMEKIYFPFPEAIKKVKKAK